MLEAQYRVKIKEGFSAAYQKAINRVIKRNFIFDDINFSFGETETFLGEREDGKEYFDVYFVIEDYGDLFEWIKKEMEENFNATIIES
ncbi:hypothetical protein [Eubacterium callanderi]|uniref:hypothetical protein n=1 Tax=Eubacterium callanderi TaxID=53442 RepID=UPI0026732B01|nr:hypothetical protein [Eubacterium callanderi]